MKKHLLTLGLAIATSVGANAQLISAGPELGLQLSNIRSNINGNTFSGELRSGLRAGAIVDVNLSKHFSLQPGVFYSRKGYELDDFVQVKINNLLYDRTVVSRVGINYIEIPLNLQYKFLHTHAGNLFAGAGPYVAVAVGGKIEDEITETLASGNDGRTTIEAESYPLEIGDNPATDDIKSTDIGLNINFGYMWRKGFLVRTQAGIGLANIAPGGNSDYSSRNFSFGFTVGYLLGK